MAASNNNFGYIIEWKIRNFSLWVQKILDSSILISPWFSIETIDNSVWKLALYYAKDNCFTLSLIEKETNIETDEINSKITVFKENFPCILHKENLLILQRKRRVVKHFPIAISKLMNVKQFSLEDTLVVKCHFWKETTDSCIKCLAVTQISMETFHISLPVCYMFDKTYLSKNEVLFKCFSKKYSEIKIYCQKQNSVLNLKIQVTKENFPVFVSCEIILIKELKNSTKQYFDHWFMTGTENETWTLANIFQYETSNLEKHLDKAHLININLFISELNEFSLNDSIVYSYTIPNSKQGSQKASYNLLCNKLEKLYSEKKLCDFTIESNDKVFKIHRSVFGAISPVFCAMFELDMTEKKDSTVKIEDVDSDILEKMIHFVYTANVSDSDWSDILKLYAAADKYQITELKESCARIMISKLDVDLVFDALIFADLYQDQMLMIYTKRLISENVKQVFHSEKWNIFMQDNPKIACGVMHEIFIVPSTE